MEGGKDEEKKKKEVRNIIETNENKSKQEQGLI